MAKLPRIARAAVALHHSNDNLNKHQQWGNARKIVGRKSSQSLKKYSEKLLDSSTGRYSLVCTANTLSWALLIRLEIFK